MEVSKGDRRSCNYYNEVSSREKDWDKGYKSTGNHAFAALLLLGQIVFLLFRFFSFIRNGLFLWLASITVSLTILGVKFLRVSIYFAYQSFHADISILTDSSNISTATNRESILLIPWHNNQCDPGLHAAAVMILSCKQMTLFLEDTR